MTEYRIGFLAVASIIGLAIGSTFYMLGGRKGKWLRRFIGSAVISTTVIGLLLLFGLFQMIHLAIYPLLIVGFSMGYGADLGYEKIIRRTLYAIGVVSSGLLLAWTIGGNAWFVFPLHLGVGLWSIWLGYHNPIHAPAEECFICVLLNIGLMMYPFIVGY